MDFDIYSFLLGVIVAPIYSLGSLLFYLLRVAFHDANRIGYSVKSWFKNFLRSIKETFLGTLVGLWRVID